MDEMIGKQILVEMKKQTRMNQFSIIALVFVIGAGVVLTKSINKKRSEQAQPSWSQVKPALDRGDYAKALQVAQMLIGNRADDSYGEEYLGAIYRLKGDMENARVHYARAYELYPSEEYEKNLVAIQKALD